RLLVEPGERLVAGRLEIGESGTDPVPSGLELGEVGLDRLGALHDLELEVLELALAPGEGLELVLERLEVLRRAGSRGEPGLVAGGPVADLLDVGLGLAQLPLD